MKVAPVAVREAGILIVDDQLMTVRLMEATLRRAGFAFLQSTTDARAVDGLVHAAAPDLLLLDLNMPSSDGFAIIARLRDLAHLRLPAIILVTADHDSATVERALACGVEAVITKPFLPEDLIARVTAVLLQRIAVASPGESEEAA